MSTGGEYSPLGGIGGIIGIVRNLQRADALDERATKKVVKAFTKGAEAEAAREQSQEEMKMEVTKLINRKKPCYAPQWIHF